MKKTAIDLHDTICGYMTRFVEIYGWPAVWSGSLPDMYPEDLLEEHFKSRNHAQFLRELWPYDNARKVLWRLVEKNGWMGDPIILTAARPGADQEATMGWWRMWGFPEKDIIFTGSNDKKLEYLRTHDIACIVDDQPAIINPMIMDRREVIVFHAPWNEDVARPNRRVFNWIELADLLGVRI